MEVSLRKGGAIGVLIAIAAAVTAAAASAPPEVVEDLAKVAFVSTRDGTSEIYVMNADGSEQRRLTVEPGQDASPTWSPDGSRIVFASNRAGNWEIYTMDAHGRDLKRLTENTAFDGSPSWSPDGTKIAFSSSRDGQSELYAMNDDGTRQTRLTASPADDTTPAWAPATASCNAFSGDIVFVSNRDGSYDLMLLEPDGSVSKVTDDAQQDFDPDWAPDCSRIAFDRPVGGNYDIYSIDLATRSVTRLTSAEGDDSRPSWSNDGASIVFTSLRDGHYEVYSMKPTGDDQTDLSVSFPGSDSEPEWGPGRVAPPLRVARFGSVAGNDVPVSQPIELTCGIGPRRGSLKGTNSNDVICSDDTGQMILGKPGTDQIRDYGGKDTIYGGRGRDTIISRDGVRDVIWGGPAVDQIYADRFDDIRKPTGDQIAP